MQFFIPYIGSEEGHQVHEETETALALLLSLSRQESIKPEAIVKAYYPFRVYKSEEEKHVFDLLGLSQTKKNLLLPRDISEILIECARVGDSEDKQVWLNTGKTVLDEDKVYTSITIEGLIEHEDVLNYLLEASASDLEDRFDLFQPVFTKKRFSSMRRKLKQAYNETEERITSTEHLKNQLETLYEVIQENQEKKYSTFYKDSVKKLETFKKEKEKAFQKIESSTQKEIKAINKELDDHLSALKIEKDKITQEIGDLEKRIESGDKDARRSLGDRRKRLKQCDRQERVLEDERLKRVSEIENNSYLEKQDWEEKLQAKTQEEESQDSQLLEVHSRTLNGCMELLEKISEIETILMEDQRSLSQILDIKYEQGQTLYLPFYIFKYGEENIGFYPPVKVSGEKGIKKTLKLLFAGNLQQKIDQHIIPQTNAFDGLLEKVIEELREETTLSEQYLKAFPGSNLLRSREALDRMEVGLYQIMEWQWINEKDYVMVQRYLVEKLDILNGGNIYQNQDIILETTDAMEIIAND